MPSPLSPTSAACGRAILPIFLIIAALTAVPAVAQDPAAADSLDLQARVYTLFHSGRIAEAERVALKALDADNSLTAVDRGRLYVLLAFCSIANDEEDNGLRRFGLALENDPGLAPDPVTWSPKVRRVFDMAQAERISRLLKGQEFLAVREAGICREASLRSLYLPGTGQNYKGQPMRGLFFGALFWAGAATLVYAEIALPPARQDYLDAATAADADSRWRNYRRLYQLRAASGMFTAAVYVWTFTDALWKRPALNSLPPAAEARP